MRVAVLMYLDPLWEVLTESMKIKAKVEVATKDDLG